MNPFEVESPERLNANQVCELFIKENSGIEVLQKRKHTFVWGPRGSGKSMLLRYLEPQCQFLVHSTAIGQPDLAIAAKDFLQKPNAYVGIRITCKEGYFNKSELQLLDNAASQIITEHMMNLSIASALFSTLEQQFPPSLFELSDKQRLAKLVSALFDSSSISDSRKSADGLYSMEDTPFQWAQHLFASELRKLGSFLRQTAFPDGKVVYSGSTSGYHDFLLPLAQYVNALPALSTAPLYFLVDDADRLKEQQQRIINSWMSNRDQSVICIKAAAQIHEYKSFRTRDGWDLETPHDYSEINIEELYSNQQDTYSQKVYAIMKRRLEIAKIDRTPEEYLPSDPEQERLLIEARQSARQEWETSGTPGKESDFVHRYAVARLFQELRRTKKRRNYAGFHNLVHLSSGVVRYFLEPCYLMYDEMVERNRTEELKTAIPPDVQQKVIFEYSEEFLLNTFEKIRKDIDPSQVTVLEKLHRLISSLGELFYERLTDPTSREVRIFSFTITGGPSEKAREVINLGLRYRYFQLRSYSKKEGGGREHWYILNRRLCPVFKLDPTGFEGRISIRSDLLDLALEDPTKFVKLRLKQGSDSQQELSFDEESR